MLIEYEERLGGQPSPCDDSAERLVREELPEPVLRSGPKVTESSTGILAKKRGWSEGLEEFIQR
jgi:hypothetical protein